MTGSGSEASDLGHLFLHIPLPPPPPHVSKGGLRICYCHGFRDFFMIIASSSPWKPWLRSQNLWSWMWFLICVIFSYWIVCFFSLQLLVCCVIEFVSAVIMVLFLFFFSFDNCRNVMRDTAKRGDEGHVYRQ